MKEERLQLTLQKYKRLYEITMKNYKPRNLKPRWNGKFLEKCSLPKWNEEGEESLKRPITADEIKAVIIKLPTHKSPGPDGFTGEFYKAFKEELTPILHRLFEKIQEDGRLAMSL